MRNDRYTASIELACRAQVRNPAFAFCSPSRTWGHSKVRLRSDQSSRVAAGFLPTCNGVTRQNNASPTHCNRANVEDDRNSRSHQRAARSIHAAVFLGINFDWPEILNYSLKTMVMRRPTTRRKRSVIQFSDSTIEASKVATDVEHPYATPSGLGVPVV